MTSIGPTLPPQSRGEKKRARDDLESYEPPSDNDGSSPTSPIMKKNKVIGPFLPPSIAKERPQSASESNSDSEEIGPSLPPREPNLQVVSNHDLESSTITLSYGSGSDKPQREAWMLAPPTSGDWVSRVDPTKLRNRKFNSGKISKSGLKNDATTGTIWTETLEQKRNRINDEMMGTGYTSQKIDATRKDLANDSRAQETSMRIKEYNDKNRNNSLLNSHMQTITQNTDDDPSKRTFDREKDIGGPAKIGYAKRKEIIRKAADFGSKFSQGDYL